MGYYKGDFYGRGGYYRGDPGFFSFLGGLAKGAVGLIPGVGPALAGGLEALTARKAGTAIVKASEGTLATRAAGKMTSIITKHPVLSAAGGAGLLGAATGVMGRRTVKGAEKMLGFGHRKHRRMNACNPRALRRAIRRAHAFERLAKHVIGFSSPRKPKGHMYFKRKRKR
jgi:hypothetical protein